MPLGLYPPKAGSPETYLDGGIDDVQTTITVLDASKLPDAPNIATIGLKSDFETIKYTEKSGNNLIGCVRGYEGTARAWNTGTIIANVPCAQHIYALQQKALGIETDHVGDTSHVGILASNAYETTDSGDGYPVGVTIFQVTNDSSWPHNNGLVLTHKINQFRVMQTFYSSTTADKSPRVWVRNYHVNHGWTPWRNLTHIDVNEQTGASYTLQLSDDGKQIEMNRATAQTLTIPTNANVPFPVGTQILVAQKGEGQVTIEGEEGVTLLLFEDEDTTIGVNAMAGLVKVATDTWRVRGDLEAVV